MIRSLTDSITAQKTPPEQCACICSGGFPLFDWLPFSFGLGTALHQHIRQEEEYLRQEYEDQADRKEGQVKRHRSFDHRC